MLQFLAPMLTGGLNFLGNLMGQKRQDDQLAQQQANADRNLQFQRDQFAQQQLNFQQQFGFSKEEAARQAQQWADSMGWSKEQLMRSEALQREFAQSGIKWRVDDARAAGIHPLAALGAGGASFSTPSVSVGGGGGVSAGGGSVGGFSGSQMGGVPSASNLMAGMGQDITRAIMATRSAQERDAAFEQTVKDMQLQNMALKNDLIASQVGRLRSGQVGPGMPTDPPGTAVAAPLDPKIEKRNRLIMDGEEVIGDPGWSPTQAVSDEYGDENPIVSWVYGPLKTYMDWRYHNMSESERLIHRTPRRGSGRVGGSSGGGW